jgi:uncharacterized membrane protein YccC
MIGIDILASATANIPVAVKGFSWGAAGIWSLFILIAGAIAGGLKAIGPARIYEIWTTRDKDLRAEKRVEEMETATRALHAEQRAANAEAKLVYVSNALSLLLGVVESLDPNNPALRQARELVAMAVDSDDDFAAYLKRMAQPK